MFSLGKPEEIPVEEYPFVGFGISWLTDYALKYHEHHSLARPSIAYLDEIPTMASADSDLIYWWHKAHINYPELENRARVRMIQNSLKLSNIRMEFAKRIVQIEHGFSAFPELESTHNPDRQSATFMWIRQIAI
jgi:hypothetical protein